MMQFTDEAVDRLINALKSIGSGKEPPSLPPTTTGGNNGGMEQRVAVLEAHVEHIRGDLARMSGVPTDLAVLKTRVDHLPTKGWMVGGLSGALAVVAGLIAFAEKIQALVN